MRSPNTATTQIAKNGQNKLGIFRFNPGKNKVVFPPKHPYNKVVGANIAKPIVNKMFEGNKVSSKPIIKEMERYKGIKFKKVKDIKNGGVLEMFNSGRQNKIEIVKNIKALEILVKKRHQYRMLPIIEDGGKNPDAFNLKSKKFVDIKSVDGTNGKNIITGALKGASKQGVTELIIHLRKTPDSYRNMYISLKNSILQGRNRNVKTIIIIFPNDSIKTYDIKTITDKITKRQSKK